jgi:hypothetical protein
MNNALFATGKETEKHLARQTANQKEPFLLFGNGSFDL